MLHSVGCPQPSASVFIKNWNKTSYDRACVHAFIDANNGSIYQTLPWNYRGWHGGGESNNSYIGVEMCEPSCIKYTGGANFTCSDLEKARKAVTLTYNAAVELFAFLCKEYKLNPLGKNVILSHAEGNKLGIASAHGDPEHLWKQLNMSYTMDTFRNDVKKAMAGQTIETPKENTSSSTELYRVRKNWNDAKSQLGAFKSLESAKTICKEGYKVFNSKGEIVYAPKIDEDKKFLVKVTVPNLNYRNGPGTNYSVAGIIRDYGVYTITEVKDGKGSKTGWGRLSSKKGWISLDYTKKL